MFKPRFYHIINVLYPHFDNGLHVFVYSHVVEGEKFGGGLGLSRTRKYFFTTRKHHFEILEMNRSTVLSSYCC